MTTPATDNTAYAIMCSAAWDACIVAEGDDPNSESIARYTRRLNELIIETTSAEDGPRLWLLQDTPVPLFAGINLYQCGPNAVGTGAVIMPKPMQIYDQYYLYPLTSGATRRPVFRISRLEWDTLSTTTQQGPVTQIFVDPQQLTLNINTWLTPDVNEALGTLHCVFKNVVQTFTGINDQMNFPIEWMLYLHWGLASEICQGQPQAIISRCDAKAQYYKQRLIDWDQEHETSIQPQPDQRMFQNQRRFSRG